MILSTSEELALHYTPLKMGQRCADWFRLRRFIITTILAAHVFLNKNFIREQLGMTVILADIKNHQMDPGTCEELAFPNEKQ